MPVVRFVGNIILAIATIVLSTAVLLSAYVAVSVRTRETHGLDYGAVGGDWVWLGSEPLYYRAWGDLTGPPAVLVHGHQMEGSETWRELAESLARSGMRVVAVDLPGYGHSQRDPSASHTVRAQAQALGRALNQLGLYGATVITFDTGAAVATQLAAEQPQFIGRLVLLSPVIERSSPGWRRFALRVPYLGSALVWAEQAGGPVWSWRLRGAFADAELMPAGYLKRLRSVTRIQGTVRTLLAIERAPHEDDVPEALAALTAPVLIVRGELDRIVPAEAAQALAGQMSSAQVATIEATGRYVHVEQRAQVLEAILTWVPQAP
jgi:pimeloyl-ACP methyl ester carboxylesterase